MREDATEMRRRAQRTADISTQFERNQAGGKRCCRAARRPAGTARRVPRIVGGAVNLVVAPKVGQVQRYVGLPRMTAPAFFRRCTTRASAAGYQRQNCGSPQLVGMPTTLNCSLTVIPLRAPALNEHLKGGLGRFMLPVPEIAKSDPFWLKEDPHRTAYAQQTLLGPTLPIYEVFNPAMAQVNTEHLFSVAMFDVIKDGMASEAAIDKAFKRVEAIFAKYPIQEA